MDHYQLLRTVSYNPNTGELYWIAPIRSDVPIGKIAGYIGSDGYLSIEIAGKPYLCHILIWFYMTGKWPVDQIDHKDLNRSNNRWANLRSATSSQNLANRRLSCNNTSGCKGVSFHKRTKKWIAFVKKDGKQIHLGSYSSIEEASEVRLRAAEELYGEYMRNS